MDNALFLFLFFVLGGTVLWGVGNVLKSYFLRNRKVHEDVVVVATMLGAVVFSFSAEGILNGIPKIGPDFWRSFAITAGLNVFMTYWNAKAMKWEDASIVVPLSSSMPLFLILMSWVILGEFPTPVGRTGIVCIAAGAYVLYLKCADVKLPQILARTLPGKWHTPVAFYGGPWLRLLSSRGARLALVTAYLGAVAVNFDKLATLNSSPMVFTGGAFLVVAIFIYGWSNVLGRWPTLDKSCFLLLFCLGLFVGLYTVMLNAGYYYSIVPYVGALKRTQIFWTILCAGMFLKERNTGLRLVGAGIIFAGAVLISLG